ncbi:MAG TPA: hypothetical protein VJS88_08720 [Chthoniobacterales bacterium]|nr:hypothetical protein [Chthoniobacterales bacterium]
MATQRTANVFLVRLYFFAAALVLAGIVLAARPRPVISEDRELKEIDLTTWDCRDRLEGTAKTPDGVERNRLKNRSAADSPAQKIESFETASFLQHFAAFEAQAKNRRRKDLTSAQREQLDPLEKQIVSFTGYLVIAYAGPPETTNCASTDFHDWHLELFDQPLDHAPGIGDPTPIICEITPRTQNAIFKDNVRIQALAGFIRAPDLSIEPTGHPPRKIRLAGYLLWDDEHNGTADVGTKISTIGANQYHQPWRSTAWEVHPVTKVELLEPSINSPAPTTPPPVKEFPSPSAKAIASAAPTSTPAPQFVTILQPVKVKIPYGETVLQRGTKLPIVFRDANTVTVRYLDSTYQVPIASTDLR